MVALRLRLALILCSVGCYEHHTVASGGAGDARASDAGRRDAPRSDVGGVDASTREGGIADGGLRLFDGAPFPDAEGPVAPGERPSDDPGAADWLPSPPASDDPCCTVGEIVGIDDPVDEVTMPVVAWNGSGWGVAWRDFEHVEPHDLIGFRSISELAEPLGSVSLLDGIVGIPAGLAWGNGRYALLLTHGSSMLVILDRDGLPRMARGFPRAYDGAVARYVIARGWVVATIDEDEDAGEDRRHAHLELYDDALRRVGPSRELGPALNLDRWSIDLVDMRSRFVVLQAAPDGVWIRTYEGAGLAPVHEDLRSMNFGAPRGGVPSASVLMGARLRDEVMTTFIEHGSLWSLSIDPWTNELGEPVSLVEIRHAYSPAIAGDDKIGVAGICFVDGGTADGNPEEVWFAAVNTSGQLVGAPVRIARGLDFAASCEVASGVAGEFFVIWWAASTSTPRHSVLGARVTLR